MPSANGFGTLAPQALPATSSGHAGKGVVDRPIAGAPAQVALERMRQVRSLFFGQRGRRHDHPRGAETALEGLRIQERLLHRMQRAILYRGWRVLKSKLDRPGRRGGDCDQEIVSGRTLRADQQRRRASEMGERCMAEREPLRQRRCRHVTAAEQFSSLENVGVVAGHEIDRGDLACGCDARPQGVGGLERDGQRDHRPRRQRHADIAADGGCVPDLERREERVAAFPHDRQCLPFGGASEPVELRNGACGRDVEAGGRRLQRRPVQLVQVDQRVGGNLRLREQPGAAGKPCVSVAPLRDLIR
jgi:hypothetical protein